MADPRAIRNTRLENEYRELMRINGSVIQIEPLGNAPYERYKLTFNLRTIIDPRPTYRAQTVCTLIIPPNYPSAAPRIEADHTPYPWHPNWFPSGSWCIGGWVPEESLVNFIHRCARTIQFDPNITNPRSAANSSAVDFWQRNISNRNVIPADTTPLPTPDSGPTISSPEPRISILQPEDKPRISISSPANKPKIVIRGSD